MVVEGPLRETSRSYLSKPFVKHKLKDCTMIRKFMTSGALFQGKKPEGDLGRKGMAPALREAVVMKIFD
jgi:hypothetical protein